RSSTPVAAWPGSRRGTARRRPTPPPSSVDAGERVNGPLRRRRHVHLRPATCQSLNSPEVVQRLTQSGDVVSDQFDQFEAVGPMLDEHARIERELADPAVHADAGRARTLGRRYAELGRVVTAYRAWEQAAGDA